MNLKNGGIITSENQNFRKGIIFPAGDPLPEMFSKYFAGQAYLNMLTMEGLVIGNVTFEPNVLK